MRQAMSDNTSLDIGALDLPDDEKYFFARIPVERDEQISDLIRTWASLAPNERSEAFASLSDDRRATLLAYSERIASQAVRTNSRECILLGLIALGLDGWQGDWRDNTLLLCLHFDASIRVGVDPSSVFSEAARLLSPSVRDGLLKFTKRAPEDQTLEAMGYRTSADDDGFRYERTW
jgi:hypothetical protein